MDHGLNPTPALRIQGTTGYEIQRQERTNPVRTAAPKSRPSEPADAREVTEVDGRTRGRISVALGAVAQFTDLLVSVHEAAFANRDLPGSELANQRLLKSAHAAARDMIDHARFDGEPIFAPPSPRTSLRGGSAAYVAQAAAYRAATRSSAAEHELETIRQVLASPGGLIDELLPLAESHTNVESLGDRILAMHRRAVELAEALGEAALSDSRQSGSLDIRT